MSLFQGCLRCKTLTCIQTFFHPTDELLWHKSLWEMWGRTVKPAFWPHLMKTGTETSACRHQKVSQLNDAFFPQREMRILPQICSCSCLQKLQLSSSNRALCHLKTADYSKNWTPHIHLGHCVLGYWYCFNFPLEPCCICPQKKTSLGLWDGKSLQTGKSTLFPLERGCNCINHRSQVLSTGRHK